MSGKRKGMTNRQKRDAGLKVANPDRVRAEQELRRSNAARPWDPRPRRQRSRASSLRAALRDQ